MPPASLRTTRRATASALLPVLATAAGASLLGAPAPAVAAASGTAAIRLVAPAPGAPANSPLRLAAIAPAARVVVFRARWTDADGVSRLHRIGTDRSPAGGWTTTWDSAPVAGQTGVTVSARALGRGGRVLGTTPERPLRPADGGASTDPAVDASSTSAVPAASAPRPALPPVAGTFEVKGTCAAGPSCTLTVRSAPSAAAAKVGTLAEGARTGVRCQATGSRVTTAAGSTATWDLVGDGRWVSDLYVATPKDGGSIPRCPAGL